VSVQLRLVKVLALGVIRRVGGVSGPADDCGVNCLLPPLNSPIGLSNNSPFISYLVYDSYLYRMVQEQ
jgi:hypothetical protein